MTLARIAWISIAPVKALSLVHLDEAWIGPTGVPHDRRFCFIDESDRQIGDKRLGILVRIKPEYDPATERLAFRMPDGNVVDGQVELGQPIDALFSTGPRKADIVAGPWSDAVSAWTAKPLRLVRLREAAGGLDRRTIGGSTTMVSVAALDALAAAAGGAGRVDGRRFRMTFGIDGIEAHAEDGWLGRPVSIGDAIVVPGGRVGRCAVTTQDPDTGVPDLDTLRTIAQYRADVDQDAPIPFGVWAQVEQPGLVRVGDAVAVDEATPAIA
jgi:uncharacterized protein YcbX